MKKIFIFGYYGFQNSGDEAILEAIIQQIKTVLPDAELRALSYNARDTQSKHRIPAVSRNNFSQVIRAIRESDIVISGGGSILQDVTSSRSLLYYSAIIYLAKLMDKKVMFYGNGFGPINRPLNRMIIRFIVNKVDSITVRDFESKEYMKSLGVKKNISVTADIALGLTGDKDEKIKQIMLRENINREEKWVGISVRPWKNQEDYKKVIAKTADHLIGKNYRIVFIPMQFPTDVLVSREIAGLMEGQPQIIERQYKPRELIGLIGNLNFLLGMRLHSLIFAAMGGVPMVGLEYDVKIKNFLKIVNQKNAGPIEGLDFTNMWQIIEDMLRNREEYVRILKKSKESLDKRLETNMDIFRDLIYEGVGE